MPDNLIDQALRQAPEVSVPTHFAQRVQARIANLPAEAPEREWLGPAISIAAWTSVAALGAAALALGAQGWFSQPAVLASILGIEVTGSLAWIWRVFRSAG